MFRPICPPAFFRCLSTSGTFTELRTTSFIETMDVAYSDSVSHNRVQVLRIPVLLLACSEDWTCNLQMIVFLEAQGTNAENHYAICPAGQFRVNWIWIQFLCLTDYRWWSAGSRGLFWPGFVTGHGEQATLVVSIKDVVRSSVKVPEFDKHLKKAGGHIGQNVVEITIKMKTIARNTLMIKINLQFCWVLSIFALI